MYVILSLKNNTFSCCSWKYDLKILVQKNSYVPSVLTYYRLVKANRAAHLIPRRCEIQAYLNFFTDHRLHSKQITHASYIVLLQQTGTFHKCRNLSFNISWKTGYCLIFLQVSILNNHKNLIINQILPHLPTLLQ